MLDPATDKQGEAWCYLGKSTTVIGVPFQPDVTQVTYDGALFTRHAELDFFYGVHNKPLLARSKTFIDGWIPIVHYSWKDGDIEYNIEYFALPLEGENAENTVNFIRYTMHNVGRRPANGQLTAGLRFDAKDYRFGPPAEKFSPSWRYEMTGSAVIRDRKFAYCFSPGGVKEAVPGNIYQKAFNGSKYFITPRAACCLTKYKRLLKPGEKYVAYFKMPRIPVSISDTAFINNLNKATYVVYRKRALRYWKGLIDEDTKIEIPEKRFQDAYRAGLVYVLLSTREKDGKKYQTDGLPYPDFFLTSMPEITMLFLTSGLWKYPMDVLIPDAIKEQLPNGLFFDRSVAHGKVIPATQGHVLYSIAMTILYTRNRQFAGQVYPAIKKGVQYIQNSIDSDQYGLLPPCYAYDAEMIKGHYTGQNLFALMGLRNCVRVARFLGKAKDVAAWTALANRYDKNILRAINASAKPDGYVPPGLYHYLTGSNARKGFEEYQTNNNWENMILAYPTEILSPSDPRVAGTLSHIRKEYAEGIMTYRHGQDLHQYITSNMIEQYLAIGRGFTALKDFYHQLLHSGSTLECFENLVRPWTDRMVDPDVPTPHAWGSAKQALMVRYFLLMEYGGKCGLSPDKRELLLFTCLSPDWVIPGKKLSIANAPTEFGRISASMSFADHGALITIRKKFYTNPAYFRIRIPYFKELVSFKTNAKVKKLEGNSIVISPDATRVSIEWRDKPGSQTGTVDNILLEYRSGDRFMGIDKNGNGIIKQSKPFLTNEEKSDSDKIEPLSFRLVRQTFQYEYKRLADSCLKHGGSLLEITAPALLTADERKALFKEEYSK
jgi:hypothetical protein